MNTGLSKVQKLLESEERQWIVTGAAGFIGINLVHFLLSHYQKVIGLDNFSTGSKRNLSRLEQSLSTEQRRGFEFFEGDIRDISTLNRVITPDSIVLHQAALGSVPRSIEDPMTTNDVNVGGFLNVLSTASRVGAWRLVYAASSSTYGDHQGLPKSEPIIGKPLSPYAVTKYTNELYAEVFSQQYELPCVGLRYFNVFGRSQDPNGAYAAVIPRWIAAASSGADIFINGDGETSRDFCYIDNVIQANVLAALADRGGHDVFNVACGDSTSLTELANVIVSTLGKDSSIIKYRDFRVGDVRHSLADISKIRAKLGYEPIIRIKEGLERTIEWYKNDLR